MYSSEIGIVAESVDLNPMKEGSSPKKKFLFFRTIALVMVVALLSFLVISMILQSEMSHTGVGQQSSKLGGYFCPPRRNYQDQSSTIGIYIRAFLTSLMLISVSHRVAGYLCGIVVRHCLCKIPGSFQVEIGWMALRLGFDRNEVVFHSIKWHNPPAFQDTPYFLTIQEVVVKFDILACFGALYNHKKHVAHVHLIELDNVEINILKLRTKGKGRDSEKEKSDSNSKSTINFWCALGEVDEEEIRDKEDYSSRVGNYVSSLMDSIHHSIGSSKLSNSSQQSNNSSSLVGGTGGGGGGASEHRDSLLNIFHSKSHHTESSKTQDSIVHHDSRSSVKDDNDALALDAARKFDEDHEPGKKASFTEKVGMSFLSVSRHMHLDKGPKTNITSNPSNPVHSVEVDNTDLNVSTDDDIECSTFPGVEASKAGNLQNSGIESNSETNPLTSARKKKTKSPHMGIKYKFQVDQLILKDLKVHAQDFLYATHCESSDSKTIKLAALVFDYKQLNKRDEKEKEKDKEKGKEKEKEKNKEKEKDKDKDKEIEKEKEKQKSYFSLSSSQTVKKENISDGENVEGSYADEILHRIINVLSYEILSKNKLSLASNLFGAAANHTASAVRDAATSAKRGVVESVTAHNKELFNIANRALCKHSKSEMMKLKVRILLGRNFKQGNRLLDSTLVCSLRILSSMESEGVKSSRSESVKSHPKRPDNDFITTWNDVMTLSHTLSYDAVLHVRVFEQHILKDAFVCECFLPLRQLQGMSGPGSAGRGDKDRERERERDNGSPHSDCCAEGEGVKEDSERHSRGSARESGKGKDDREGKSSAVQSVKVIEKESEKGKEKEKEKGVAHAAEEDTSMLHVFGNMFHSAHTAFTEHIPVMSLTSSSTTATSVTGIAGRDIVSLNPLKGAVSSSSSSSSSSRVSPSIVNIDSSTDYHSDADKVTDYPPRSPVTATTTGSVTASASAGIADKKVPSVIVGSENIAWHKCYGRKGDHEESVEKGEIYLGMLLE